MNEKDARRLDEIERELYLLASEPRNEGETAISLRSLAYGLEMLRAGNAVRSAIVSARIVKPKGI